MAEHIVSGAFYRCENCGQEAEVDTSVVMASNPPCYTYVCKHCGNVGYTNKNICDLFNHKVTPIDDSLQIQSNSTFDSAKDNGMSSITITSPQTNGTVTSSKENVGITRKRCILCDNGVQGFGMVCNECKNAIEWVKKIMKLNNQK